jgi:DnaJ-class molecular chaperone
MSKKEDLEEKLNNAKQEYEQLENKMYSIEQHMTNIIEEMFENDDIHIKIICPECNGKEMVKKGDSRVVCSVCNGKGYIWAKKWSE